MSERRDEYPERAREEPGETVIDVSGEHPEVVPHDATGQPTFPTSIGQARVYVAQGGPRACLIPLGLLLLLTCCACATAWVLVDNLF